MPDFDTYDERVRAYAKGTEDAEEVVVLTPSTSNGSSLASRGLPLSWKVQYLPKRRKLFLGPWIKQYVVSLTQNRRFDIVHDHFYYMVTSFGQLRRMTAPPALVESIYIFNRQWIEKTRWSLPVLSLTTDYSRLRNLHGEWTSVRGTDYLVLQSEFLREGIQDHYKDINARLLFLPNAVDHALFHPGDWDRSRFGFPRDSIVVLSIGYVGYRRGTDVSLQAFSRAIRMEPRLRFVIGGNYIEREKKSLMASVENHRLADRVLFLGHVARENLANLYRSADIFLLTSFQEGMPRVVLEAMSSGLPVVASRLPGVQAIDPDGKCIVLVPPGDSEAFSEALLSLARDPEERLKRGLEGRTLVEEGHTIEKVGCAIAEMYRSIMQERG